MLNVSGLGRVRLTVKTPNPIFIYEFLDQTERCGPNIWPVSVRDIMGLIFQLGPNIEHANKDVWAGCWPKFQAIILWVNPEFPFSPTDTEFEFGLNGRLCLSA